MASLIQLEKRIRSLRKAMSLDFQPLRDTLSKALSIPMETEAAVYCTSCVEAFCQVLFDVIVQRLEQQAFLSNDPLETKISVHHLQLALRSHHELVKLTSAVESVSVVMDLFLEEATMEQLLALNLLEQDEAQEIKRQRQVQHQQADAQSADSAPGQQESAIFELTESELQTNAEMNGGVDDNGIGGEYESDAGSEDMAEDEVHDLMRMEWQKRSDDPFSDVDFARILKCVHPAFTLQYNAMVFLSALIREFLNEFCQLMVCQLDKAIISAKPKALLLDHVQPLFTKLFQLDTSQIGAQMVANMANCLQRFRLQSAKSKTLSIRVQLFPSTSYVNSSTFLNEPSSNSTTTSTSASTLSISSSSSAAASPSQVIGFRVTRDTLFQDLLPPICKKFQLHCQADQMVLVFRSQSLDGAASASSVGMRNGSLVFLMVRKWWHEFRRNEARRGLMSSVKPQALGDLKTRLDQSQSKVKQMLQSTSNSSGNNDRGDHREEDTESSAKHHRGFPMVRDVSFGSKRSGANDGTGVTGSGGAGSGLLHAKHFRAVKSKPLRQEYRQHASASDDNDQEGPDQQDQEQEDWVDRVPRKRHAAVVHSPRPSPGPGPALVTLDKSASASELPRNAYATMLGASVSTSALPALQSPRDDDSLSALVKQRGANSPLTLPVPLPFRSPIHAPSSPSTAATIQIASLSLRATQVMAALDDAWLSFANLSGDMREIKDKFLKLERDQQDAHSTMPWSSNASSSWQHALAPLLKARLDQFDMLISQTQTAKKLLSQLAQDTMSSARSVK